VLAHELPCSLSSAGVNLKLIREGFSRFIGGNNQVLLYRASGCDLLKCSLLLIKRADVGQHETCVQNSFLNGVPHRVLRIVKLYRHPAPRFKQAIKCPKTIFHEALVFPQGFLLLLANDCFILVVGKDTQPGFREEIQLGIHQITTKRWINKNVIRKHGIVLQRNR